VRQVHQGENLDGQTLDAIAVDARQSLFSACSMRGTILKGDWRGSDLLGCDLSGADLTAANFYATYWRGNTLTGALFPAGIGYFHHEPIKEIIRAGVVAYPLAQAFAGTLITFLGSPSTASWTTVSRNFNSTFTAIQRANIRAGFRSIFAPYPQLLVRYNWLLAAEDKGQTFAAMSLPAADDVSWPNGPTVHVDSTALPVLPDPSRYSLSRWIEGQAGAGHFCFVNSISPMNVRILSMPDDWVSFPLIGY
jgi:Pentapeptide repeats (8 copies)